jgi:hypothetical protein|tara:strand:+ start:339 stop:797 length:459 start_codon:yes stop_codon:yes gene_type:complete
LGEKAIEMLTKGYTQKMVREEFNINYETWKCWMHKPKEKGGRPGFKERVYEAERCSKQNMLDLVQFHAEKDWRAAAWYLERTTAEFKLRTFRSQEAQGLIDKVAIEKAEAERDLVLAKTKALQKNLMTPEELLDLLKDAREINTSHSRDTAH